MKNIKKCVTMAVAAVMMLSFAGCNVLERTPENMQKTVYAKVGKVKITKADVDKLLKPQLDQCKQQYGDDFESNDKVKESLQTMRKQALEQLVSQEVLLQGKELVGVNPTDDEVQEKVDEMIKMYKDRSGSDEQYQSLLEENGFDEDSFVEFMKKQIVSNMVGEKIAKDAEASDEDVENYYNENIDNYKGKAGAEVIHLLFMPEQDGTGNATEEADAKAKALADSAREQAANGKSLKEVSESDEFKDKGTYQELGRVPFEDSKMVPEFEAAFKNLPVNQVSDVVKTQYGYHIIVNTATYADDEVTPLNDALKTTIRQTISRDKQDEAYQSKIDELKEKLKVKEYEDRI